MLPGVNGHVTLRNEGKSFLCGRNQLQQLLLGAAAMRGDEMGEVDRQCMRMGGWGESGYSIILLGCLPVAAYRFRYTFELVGGGAMAMMMTSANPLSPSFLLTNFLEERGYPELPRKMTDTREYPQYFVKKS